MKKIALFALAALCTAAVRAVSISWSGDGWKEVTNSFGLSNGESAVISASITYGDTLSTGPILSFGAGTNNHVMSLTITENGKYALVGKNFNTGIGNETIESEVSATAGGTDTITLKIDRLGPRGDTGVISNQVMAVKLYINDEFVTQMQDTYLNNVWYGAYTDENLDMNFIYAGCEVGGSPGYNGTYSMTLTASIVPEPTALALLALGVAGLALKRKVA